MMISLRDDPQSNISLASNARCSLIFSCRLVIEFKKGGLLSDRCWALHQGVQTANLNKTAIQMLHSMTLMAWLNCWVSSIVRVIMHDETMQMTQHRGPVTATLYGST